MKKFILPLLFIALTTISTIVGRVSFLDYLFFVATQIFLVFCPGAMLYRVFGFKSNNQTEYLFSSYLLGYGLSITLYIGCLLLKCQELVLYPSVMLSGVSLFFLIRTGDYKRVQCDDKTSIIFNVVVISLAYGIGLITYTCNNLSPAITGYTLQNQDYLFWMRNCVACTIDFPVHDMSVMGNNLYYHYFSSMHIAYLHYVSNIEIFDLCFVYTSLIITILVFGGTYLLVNVIIKDTWLSKLAMVMLLFTTCIENVTYLYYTNHIYVGSFGLAEGLGMSLFALSLAIRLLTNFETNNFKLLLAFLFVLAVATGLKAPLALVVLGGFGITCFCMLFQVQQRYNAIIIGVASLLVFVGVYYCFIMNHDNSLDSSNRLPEFSFVATILRSPFENKLFSLFNGIVHSEILSSIIVFIVYVVLVLFLPLTILFLTKKERWKNIKPISIIFLLSVGLIGFVLTTFFSHDGMSQMYYWFIGYPAIIVGLSSVMGEVQSLHGKAKYLMLSAIGFGLVGLLSTIYIPTKNGLRNLLLPSSTAGDINGFSQTADELAAMRWLRDNTGPSSIVVSNKVLAEVGGHRSFILSAFSERQAYLEGYDYSTVNDNMCKHRLGLIKSLYSGEKDSISLIKSEGVDYVVLFKNIGNSALSIDNCVVFENDAVKIYKL